MGVDASAVARIVGIDAEFKDFRDGKTVILPQHLAVIGQGATGTVYPNEKLRFTNALQVGQKYGFGCPLHLAAQQLFPTSGDGLGSIPVTFFGLDDDVGGVSSTGEIAISGTQVGTGSYKVLINKVPSGGFVIPDAAVAATDNLEDIVADAIAASLNMPMTAVAENVGHTVDLTSKWKGASANDLHIEIVGPMLGIVFVITQPSGGGGNPDIQSALDKFGTSIWYTCVLNCMEIADTATLDKLKLHGEGRHGELVHKPYGAFTGMTAATVAAATAVSSVRTGDKVNGQISAPGCLNLPFVVAARGLARILKRANNNPAYGYGSMPLTGLTPGADEEQWDYPQRDQAVKAGSGTTRVQDATIVLGDVVMFYAPVGDPNPSFRFFKTLVKLQNIIFNLDLEFDSAKWDGRPMLPNSDPTVNREARKPKHAITAAAKIVTNLGLNAILSNVEATKASISAHISESNPDRLQLLVPAQVSGNVNIIDLKLEYGFYYGTAPLVA